MSDGDKWIRESTQRIALALRAGREGRAVGAAEKVLDKWVSRELKKEEIAAVGEYVSNAVGDLVLLALWSRVGDVLRDAPQIPTWLFARDDRITKCVAFFVRARELTIRTERWRNTWWTSRRAEGMRSSHA